MQKSYLIKSDTMKIIIKKPGVLIQAVCMWCLLTLSTTPAQAGNEEAVAVVENLHTILLDNMKTSDSHGYRERYESISPFIEQNFDLDLIVKVILSRYWNKFSEDQKTRFIELFKQLTVATYASRFVEFKNEKFVTISVDPLKKGRLLIKTEILAEGEDPVRLDYLMHQRDGRWLIISVVANGVNDLSLKRAEYGTIIKDQGYDDLVRQLKEKIQQYESS